MGHPADPIMRVNTSGTEARGKHYSNDPATAGLVFTSTGPDTVPTWAPGGPGADILIERVVFVDGAAPALGANGTLNHPFPTVQGAVNLVATNLWNDAIVMVAPGVYPGAIIIPAAPIVYIAITGWGLANPVRLADLPELSGAITANATTEIAFSKVNLTGQSIAPAIPAAQNLIVSMSNCRCAAALQASGLSASFVQTDLLGALTGSNSTMLRCDGYTWARIVYNEVVISPIDYQREFYDTGADTYMGSLDVVDMSVGATQTVSIPYIGVLPDEYAIPCLDLPAATDFTLTFSHTDFDEVFFRLTNDSRGSGDFVDTFTVLVFHANMSRIPVRP